MTNIINPKIIVEGQALSAGETRSTIQGLINKATPLKIEELDIK
jgi:hypothetical protein